MKNNENNGHTQFLNSVSIAEIIRAAKENDENAMLEIIEKFQPLINKYFRRAYYNEDMKSSLELKLIEIIKAEINLNKLRDNDEGTIINYITSSLYHHYLAILRKNMNSDMEIGCENDSLIDLFDKRKFASEGNIEDNLLFEALKDILTEREFECVYYIVFSGYTAEELAKRWNITKQACNQCKKRAFKKVLEYFMK